jgi:hypothetical protein
MPASPEQAPSELPVLPYTDLPARWGVIAKCGQDGVRIIIPPVPSWRQLHRGFFIGAAVLGAIVVTISINVIRTGDVGVIPAIAIYGIGLFFVILAAANRLTRRLIFQVNSGELSLETVGGWSGRRRGVWPLRDVGEIKFNPSNKKLLLRITGRDLVEYFVSPDVRVTQWVAEQLARALREQPFTPTWPLASDVHDPADGARSPMRRSMLLALGVSMCAGGVLMMFFDLPWPVLGIYVLLFSAAPFGIALGTRPPKKYYWV